MDDELYGQIQEMLEVKLGRKPTEYEITEEFTNMCDAMNDREDNISWNGDY